MALRSLTIVLALFALSYAMTNDQIIPEEDFAIPEAEVSFLDESKPSKATKLDWGTQTSIDEQERCHTALQKNIAEIKETARTFGELIAQDDHGTLIAKIKKAVATGEIPAEAPIQFLDTLDTNKDGQLDEAELSQVVDGNIVHHWNIRFSPHAPAPKKEPAAASNIVKTAFTTLFEAAKFHVNSEGIPESAQRFTNMKDYSSQYLSKPRDEPHATAAAAQPSRHLDDDDVKLVQSTWPSFRFPFHNSLAWFRTLTNKINRLMSSYRQNLEALKSKITFDAPDAQAAAPTLSRALTTWKNNFFPQAGSGRDGQDCRFTADCAWNLVCTFGKCRGSTQWGELAIGIGESKQNTLRKMLRRVGKQRALDAKKIAANMDRLVDLKNKKNAAMLELVKQGLLVRKAQANIRSNFQRGLGQSWGTYWLTTIMRAHKAALTAQKHKLNEMHQHEQAMRLRMDMQERLHNIKYQTFEEDMNDLKKNPSALSRRYADVSINASDEQLDNAFNNRNIDVMKDITSEVEQAQQAGQSRNSLPKSGVVGYKESWSQNLGEWKIGGDDSNTMFSIDAEQNLGAGVCGMAKVCVEAGAEIKASFIHTVHDTCTCKTTSTNAAASCSEYHTPCDKVQVYESVKVYAQASAEAGFDGKELTLNAEMEVGVAAEVGVTNQHDFGDFTVRQDTKVEVGVVARAEAEASIGANGAQLDADAYTGAYAKVESTTYVGNDDVNGALTGAVISPGSAGAGASGELSVSSNGELTIGGGGCLAIVIGGLCAEVAVTVDTKPAIEFLSNNLVEPAEAGLKIIAESEPVQHATAAVTTYASKVEEKAKKGDVGGTIAAVYGQRRLLAL